jgi:hypothetical protein
MNQRGAHARTRIPGSVLLFPDEPTSGPGPVSTRQVNGIIRHGRTGGSTAAAPPPSRFKRINPFFPNLTCRKEIGAGKLEVRRSRFHMHLYAAESGEDLGLILDLHRTRHKKAAHHSHCAALFFSGRGARLPFRCSKTTAGSACRENRSSNCSGPRGWRITPSSPPGSLAGSDGGTEGLPVRLLPRERVW